MKKVVFLNFRSDYNKLEIESISNDYDIVAINIPRVLTVVFKWLSKYSIFDLSRQVISSVYIYYISRKLAGANLILCSEHLDLALLRSISYINTKKVIILRNIMTEGLSKFTPYFDMYTFDESDAKKYSISKYNQFASGYHYIKTLKVSPEFDCCFIGREKGRRKILNSLVSMLPGFKIDLLLVSDVSFIESLFIRLKLKKSPALTYKSYLNRQLNAKVVIDFVQVGQVGLTMRTIEALLAQRKVITNNKSVFDMDFFSSGNVYYFDENYPDYNSLQKFMAQSFIEIDEALLEKYSPRYNLNKVIGSILDE